MGLPPQAQSLCLPREEENITVHSSTTDSILLKRMAPAGGGISAQTPGCKTTPSESLSYNGPRQSLGHVTSPACHKPWFMTTHIPSAAPDPQLTSLQVLTRQLKRWG